MYMNPLNYVTNLWRFLTSIHFISDAKIKKENRKPSNILLKISVRCRIYTDVHLSCQIKWGGGGGGERK